MTYKIEPCLPPVNNRGYQNPQSQNTLITQTSGWPRQRRSLREHFSFNRGGYMTPIEYLNDTDEDLRPNVPKGLKVGSIHADQMQYQRDRYEKMAELLVSRVTGYGDFNRKLEMADEETLLEMASMYLELNVVAVRWVYYFNVATCYDCQRMDYLFKP